MDAPVPAISDAEWRPEDALPILRALLRDRYAEHPDSELLSDRIDAHLPALWTAFAEVYGDGAEQATWVVRAVDAAVEGRTHRADRLCALDQSRASAPDWFQGPEQIGYMCYVDLFAGTLDGVREKIPYLKELGVTYLHLMPLLESRDGPDDGGYAVTDYRSVDPALGTMDDLRALADALHEEDMLLALDVVMNHTAREHGWAQAALDGDERHRDFYLTYEDRTLPDRYEQTLPEVFPDFAPGNFTYVDALDRWVWTSFYDFQWDLDYANPDVFVQMFREMMVVANTGADALRLDAVPFLWKERGTNCRNRPEAHWILRAYRALMNIAAPGTLFKAEAIVAPEDIVRYLGVGGHEGEECDIAYNAALMSHLWHALASENTQLLRRALTSLPDTPSSASWLNYLRCHDDIGWGLDDADVRAVGQDPVDTRRFCADFYAGHLADSYAEGYDFQVDAETGEARTSGTLAALTGLQKAQVEGTPETVEQALRRTLLLHNVIFVMKGMPLLYSGDEIGQLNDFSYLNDPLKADDNRWVHRPPMDWDRAALRHEEGRVEQRLFDGLRRLVDARKGLDVLHARADERVLRPANDQVFMVERSDADRRLLAVSNFSDTPQAVPLARLPEAWGQRTYTEVVRDETAVFSSGRILLPPYGFRWLRPAPGADPGPSVPTRIEIEVHTEWGEEVYLCGSTEALGTNRPEAAVGPLSAEDYPRWTTEVELPAGTYVEFEWLKKRDGTVVARSPCRYGVKAGHDKVWRLEG
ncbi:MAG: alpha-amylase family glycosyl hydrolase [Salinibacter sp.]